jgi:hypothetical protein
MRIVVPLKLMIAQYRRKWYDVGKISTSPMDFLADVGKKTTDVE